MTAASTVRWQVTISCGRPPRVPGYENDTWHLQPQRVRKCVRNVMTLDDFEVVFTPRRVRLRYTLDVELNPHRKYDTRVGATVHGAGWGARALAAVFQGCFFDVPLDTTAEAALPGPVRVELVEQKPTPR